MEMPHCMKEEEKTTNLSDKSKRCAEQQEVNEG